MVSHCCKLLVKKQLTDLGFRVLSIELGEVEVDGSVTREEFVQIRKVLAVNGHELLEDKRSILIEKLKSAIIEMVHYSDDLPEQKFSDYLEAKLDCDYTYASNLFSKVTGSTLHHFIILHKVEKAKELMIYNELSIKEIAYKLHYSSVPHFSNQFKKVTGLSPVLFKMLNKKRRISLEDILDEEHIQEFEN